MKIHARSRSTNPGPPLDWLSAGIPEMLVTDLAQSAEASSPWLADAQLEIDILAMGSLLGHVMPHRVIRAAKKAASIGSTRNLAGRPDFFSRVRRATTWYNPPRYQASTPLCVREICQGYLMNDNLRKATLADQPELERLIALSARKLSAQDYTPEQVEGALLGAFGVDTQLLKDGTYFVVERDGKIVGCGGWSYRRTLFGGDTHAERNPVELDPSVDAAKVRAFFVDPAHARQGIGKTILEHCESEARARGFSRFELMATLPGARLYAALGYVPGEPIQYPLPSGINMELLPMSKSVDR